MLFRLILVLIVAGVIGSVGASLAGRRTGPGCLASIALGFIGALIGSWLQGLLHAREFIVIEGLPIIWSVIGATLFVAVIGTVSSE